MKDNAKRSWAGLQWGTVEHKIVEWAFFLPNNCAPVTKLQLKSLELENHEMKSDICALNAELLETNKMLAGNQPLVSAGPQLSEINPINKQPSSMDADIFYAMAQAVIPKDST